MKRFRRPGPKSRRPPRKPPRTPDSFRGYRSKRKDLEIVGHCPRCGAPIYGRKTIGEFATPYPAKYTCGCRRHPRQDVVLG